MIYYEENVAVEASKQTPRTADLIGRDLPDVTYLPGRTLGVVVDAVFHELSPPLVPPKLLHQSDHRCLLF